MDPFRSDFYHRNGVALNGYDVVAYFKQNQAIRGSSKFACVWKKIMWQFSNEDHLKLFSQNPEKYAPQYGGYCSFGVANGYKASTRPNAFTIEDGKLYLNFAGYVKKRWLEKAKKRILSANKAWEEVKGTLPIKAHPIPIWWKYQFLKLVGRDLFG